MFALTEGTATTRQRGKAMMLDLTKLMHHRATGDLKPKPPRDKDRGTTSGAVPKLQGQLLFYLQHNGLETVPFCFWIRVDVT